MQEIMHNVVSMHANHELNCFYEKAQSSQTLNLLKGWFQIQANFEHLVVFLRFTKISQGV